MTRALMRLTRLLLTVLACAFDPADQTDQVARHRRGGGSSARPHKACLPAVAACEPWQMV